ncbi:MAG TPA: hypothetical protein VFO34_06850 [Candidatus Acidoferrales bacterium]|nr:hypothetical protein [Candidatus Acidoferrales bacterium]
MKRLAKNSSFLWVTACGLMALAGGGAPLSSAQDAKPDPYAQMAPLEQYLMERNAEIALARSAAPESVSRDATVLVLGRHGYETAVEGKNGFVCMVERAWFSAFDAPEYWNPKIRGADCLNPEAARSVLPLQRKRTDLVLAGESKSAVFDAMKAGFAKKEFPALEPGAIGYMMSKDSYLTDGGSHNMPHVMMFVPVADDAEWGAGLPGVPVGSAPYWFTTEDAKHKTAGVPVIRIFYVAVRKWSDGSVVSPM